MGLANIKIQLTVEGVYVKKGFMTSNWADTAPAKLFVEWHDVDRNERKIYPIYEGAARYLAERPYDTFFYSYAIDPGSVHTIKNDLLRLLSELDNMGWNVLGIAQDINKQVKWECSLKEVERPEPSTSKKLFSTIFVNTMVRKR